MTSSTLSLLKGYMLDIAAILEINRFMAFVTEVASLLSCLQGLL
jgi:hypothetical protein